MSAVKKKNYTLYVFIRNIQIPIKRGSLKELDDFTTYFESNEGLAKIYLRDLVKEDEKYEFYIMSSRGNRYRVLFNECRFIPSQNKIHKIKWLTYYLDSQELMFYIENNTKVFEYLESEKSENIPLCILYKLLNNEDRKFLNLFKSMLEEDYSFYRNILFRYKDEVARGFVDSLTKEKKEEIKKESDSIYYDICDAINNIKENDTNNEIIIDEKEEQVLSVINRYENSYEIMEELETLISDEYEREHYLNKYKSLIYRNKQ